MPTTKNKDRIKQNAILRTVTSLLAKRFSKEDIQNHLAENGLGDISEFQYGLYFAQASTLLKHRSLFLLRLLHGLPPGAMVLDLGAKGGSFDYSMTAAHVIALDVFFPDQNGQTTGNRLIADAHFVPVKTHSIDVVISCNTLEHFDNVAIVLAEIKRVIKPDGHLWCAVPDGYSFDDNLYRFLYDGGGHVNRFTLDSLEATVLRNANMVPVCRKKLYGSFIYLNPVKFFQAKKLPPRMRIVAHIPARLLCLLLFMLNFGVRIIDTFCKTSLSRYGWEILFKFKGDASLEIAVPSWTPAFVNVCFHCGDGHLEEAILSGVYRMFPLKFYHCWSCGKKNIFFPSFERKLCWKG